MLVRTRRPMGTVVSSVLALPLLDITDIAEACAVCNLEPKSIVTHVVPHDKLDSILEEFPLRTESAMRQVTLTCTFSPLLKTNPRLLPIAKASLCVYCFKIRSTWWNSLVLFEPEKGSFCQLRAR